MDVKKYFANILFVALFVKIVREVCMADYADSTTFLDALWPLSGKENLLAQSYSVLGSMDC